MAEPAERKGRPNLSLGSFCVWNPEFYVRNEIKYEREDKSNLDQIEEQWDLDPEEDIFDFIFLQDSDPANQWSREMQKLRSFWVGASRKAVKDGDGEAGTKAAAILDQRSRFNSEEDPRGDSKQCVGPLTPHRLYKEWGRSVSCPCHCRIYSGFRRIVITN
jgi:hypothetical protein